MTASHGLLKSASPSWPDALTTTLRLLTFRANKAELIHFTFKHLTLGLLLTWLVGIGRHWDNPRVSFLQHLGVGSVVYVFLLSLFLWLVIWPLRPQHWSYFRVLTFVCLVSPPAIVYAIPVEYFFTLSTANSVNAVFLGVVATWRVALLIFFLRRAGELHWFSTALAAILPLTLIVVTLTLLNLERVMFDLMSGIRERSANDQSYLVLIMLTYVSLLLFLPLLLGYIAMVAFEFRRRPKKLLGVESSEQ